jgi:histidine ammonia-lyase
MAAHGAFRLARMNANLSVILGVELMCAAQGIEARAPLATSDPLNRAIAMLRTDVPTLEQDRYLAPDINAATELVRTGKIKNAAEISIAL